MSLDVARSAGDGVHMRGVLAAALAAVAVVALLVGCGGSSRTLSVSAVMNAFSAEGLTLRVDRPPPDAMLLPRSDPSEGGFVVWVYQSASEAKAAVSRVSAALSGTQPQNIERVSNVVVLRAVGLLTPAGRIAASLNRLRHA